MNEMDEGQLDAVQEQLSSLLDELPTTLKRVDEMNQQRRVKRRFLHDDKELMKRHRDFIGVGIVLEEHNKNPDNPIAFISALKSRVNEIRPFNPDLAGMIEKAEISVEADVEETRVLFQLHRILNMPDTEKIIAELKQNPTYYLNNIKDEEFARKLRYLFSIVLGTEANELKKHLEDLTKLRGNLRGYIEGLERDLEVRYRIKDDVLIKKLDRFERRLPEHIDDEIKFLGERKRRVQNWVPEAGNFASYLSELLSIIKQLSQFKDKELIKAIRDTNITKRFLFFEFEHYYFADVEHHDKHGHPRMGLLKMVRKGEEEGDWKDFLEVTRNVKKEAKYVEDEFGDLEAAQRLIDIEARHHDDPEAWKTELNILIKEFIMNSERRGLILEKARSILITLFDMKRNKLLFTLQSEEAKLAEIIGDRIKDLEKRREKAIKETRAFVNKKLKETHGKTIDTMRRISEGAKAIELQARAKLEGVRAGIDKTETEVLTKFVNFVVDAEKAYDMPEQDEKVPEMLELLEKSKAWEVYIPQAIRKAGEMDPIKGFALLANHVMRGIKVIATVEERFDDIDDSILNVVTTDLLKTLQELVERGKTISTEMENLLQQYNRVTEEYSVAGEETEKAAQR